jgi:hypothetical protein
MKGKKNDFSMSFWDADGKRVLFLEYVHDTEKAKAWVASKGINWVTVNIYDRRTREKIEQQKRQL